MNDDALEGSGSRGEPVQFFGEWLARTTKIQNEAYAGNYPLLDDAVDGEVRAVEFVQQAFAVLVELAEMSQEVGWKPWGTDRTLDRERFIQEGVDVLHFVGNLLTMVGCTDEELNRLYDEKHRRNWERARSGTYDGRVEGKCPQCKRSLDDPEVLCNPGRNFCVQQLLPQLCTSCRDAGRPYPVVHNMAKHLAHHHEPGW